jgi:hypothetical protein
MVGQEKEGPVTKPILMASACAQSNVILHIECIFFHPTKLFEVRDRTKSIEMSNEDEILICILNFLIAKKYELSPGRFDASHLVS